MMYRMTQLNVNHSKFLIRGNVSVQLILVLITQLLLFGQLTMQTRILSMFTTHIKKVALLQCIMLQLLMVVVSGFLSSYRMMRTILRKVVVHLLLNSIRMQELTYRVRPSTTKLEWMVKRTSL